MKNILHICNNYPTSFDVLNATLYIKMKSSNVRIFAILTIFATCIFSQASSNDQFDKLFKSQAPIKEIMAEIMSIDPIKNYQHFQTVQNHIKNQDKYAAYAQKLVAATQKILDHILTEIGYKEEVDVIEFIDAAYGTVMGTFMPDAKMMVLMMRVNKYAEKVYEEAVEQVKKNVMEKLMGFVEGGQSNDQKSEESNEIPIASSRKGKSSDSQTVKKQTSEKSRRMRRSKAKPESAESSDSNS